ncbi:hypothetical protein [Nocardia wallacei]|uniref:hypothetical protein n=1 Tax=Nocardia wallacei TaxID=480035 RepID=UPI00245607E5|nr:hypothetical protein [Nocardia wallacei]
MSSNNIRRVCSAGRTAPDDCASVVDLQARRRCQFERSGMDPLSVAVHVLAETGEPPRWDVGHLDDDGGEDWAA